MTTVEQLAGIRPFHVEVPEKSLADLRGRLAATRWPSRELVEDRSQGVQLATMQALARYWATDYDLGRIEARLNALPQFTTEIDGVDVHFIHVHEDALPLIMTHGWPGSVIEQIDTVGPLTDPTAHGGSAEDAFHLVLPALPGYGYFVEQATRPQTIGYALLDSPLSLAAWMIDHDTDAYYKISGAFVDDRPSGNLTRDNILDNITLYWLTGTGASAARSYWEAYGPDAPTAGRQPLPPPAIPVGFTTFPGEIWRTPRSWVEASYPNVIYFNKVDKGGHFAAWEEPALFSTEVRAAFRSLR